MDGARFPWPKTFTSPPGNHTTGQIPAKRSQSQTHIFSKHTFDLQVQPLRPVQLSCSEEFHILRGLGFDSHYSQENSAGGPFGNRKCEAPLKAFGLVARIKKKNTARPVGAARKQTRKLNECFPSPTPIRELRFLLFAVKVLASVSCWSLEDLSFLRCRASESPHCC